MGYKMSGCNITGFCEVDQKMAKNYLLNMNVELPLIMPIQNLKENDDLIKKIGEIDILDGSPPCSTFSMSGNREKDWGKKRVFKEGDYKQILDTLFFDFIDLAEKIRPKVIIAENVKGMLAGNAKKYVREVVKRLENLGYIAQVFLLNGNKMGLPQSRERVFFIANKKKKINIAFNQRPIPVKDINASSFIGKPIGGNKQKKLWKRTAVGRLFSSAAKSGSYFSIRKINPLIPLPTIMGSDCFLHWERPHFISDEVLVKYSSFPSDYKFQYHPARYILGMSVPPLMIHQLAEQIVHQLF